MACYASRYRRPSPQAVCKDGDSALHYASAQGHAEVIKRLAREPSVSFTLTDADGETPEDVAQVCDGCASGPGFVWCIRASTSATSLRSQGAKIKKLLQQLAAAREEEPEGASGAEPADGEEGDDDGDDA